MIYFDNAATTYPKPMAVTNAVRTALQKYGANPDVYKRQRTSRST